MKQCKHTVLASVALAVASGSTAHAIVTPVGADDSVFVNRGLQYSADVKLGSIGGTNPAESGYFHDSFTFLTDLSGNRYMISDTPANGAILNVGGFGDHRIYGSENEGQDGNPRIGIGGRGPVTSQFDLLCLDPPAEPGQSGGGAVTYYW